MHKVQKTPRGNINFRRTVGVPTVTDYQATVIIERRYCGKTVILFQNIVLMVLEEFRR